MNEVWHKTATDLTNKLAELGLTQMGTESLFQKWITKKSSVEEMQDDCQFLTNWITRR